MDATAESFAAAMRMQDWGEIYDMSSSKEKTMQPWGRAEFNNLMTVLSELKVGKIQTVKLNGDWQRQTTRKYFEFDIHGSTGDAKVGTHFFRDYDDWHPAISSLPMRLFNDGGTPTKDDMKKFYDACLGAHVNTFVRLDDNIEFSVERLGRYLNGELPWSGVVRPATPN